MQKNKRIWGVGLAVLGGKLHLLPANAARADRTGRR